MAHFSKVGMKSRSTRFWVAMVHLILILGSITMIVPFLVMLSTSFSSNVDSNDFSLIPRYWRDDRALFQKYTESAFNEDLVLYHTYTRTEEDFRNVEIPRKMSDAEGEAFEAFKATLPNHMTICAHGLSIAKPRTGLEGAGLWQTFLQKRYREDIQEVNRVHEDTREYFDMQVPAEKWGDRRYQPAQTVRFRDLVEFKTTLPTRFKTPVSVDGIFLQYLKTHFELSDAEVPKRYGTAFKTMADIRLTRTLPTAPAQFAKDWAEFTCSEDGLGLPFLVASPAAAGEWRAYLQKRYAGHIQEFNLHTFGKDTKQYIAGFDAIPFYDRVPKLETLASDWAFWIKETRPARHLTVDAPDFRYQDMLHKKYRNVAALNQAFGLKAASFAAVSLPLSEANWRYLLAEKGAIKAEFIKRNYRDVVKYVAMRGRAMRNTVILVLATILVTLTVNPLAAYALSRFNLPKTQQILLFLLATMAFPAEVSAIPGFLLLKQFHMLNTYWALILPGMANGYSIFLLKGFFDSLPQELYEAADLDGAGPVTIFARLVMPMSTPILAVIALGAFNHAYGSFMWAFIVCQDEKMWTLMVWLQQMSMWASQSMIFAALVISAIPTLIVFTFMQRVIMQGIIIPMEK